MAGNNGRFCLHIFNNLATYDSHGNNIALRVYYFIKVECRNKNKALKTKNLEKSADNSICKYIQLSKK